MIDTINTLIDNATTILKIGGPLAGFLLIFIESIIPVLPLGAFITLNMNAFGKIFGFILSWVATCCGCMTSYILFATLYDKLIIKFISSKKQEQLKRITNKMKSIPFRQLVVIMALPFTPAFLVNIACGLSQMNKEKFILAVMISKVSIVYFWGYIGTSFLESMSDINTIITLCIMMIVAYFVSYVVSKQANIK